MFLYNSCAISETITTENDDTYNVTTMDLKFEIFNDICYVYAEYPSSYMLSKFYLIDNFYYHWYINRYIPVVFPKWSYWVDNYHYYNNEFHLNGYVHHPRVIYDYQKKYPHVDYNHNRRQNNNHNPHQHHPNEPNRHRDNGDMRHNDEHKRITPNRNEHLHFPQNENHRNRENPNRTIPTRERNLNNIQRRR